MTRSRGVVAGIAGLLVALTLIPGVPAAAAPASPAAPGSAGAAEARTEWWHDAYGISSAWTTTRGKGVTIAIIDSGIGSHPAVNGNVVDGEDFSGDGSSDGRKPVSDHPDHGTLVASLAAGSIGSAPEAKLLSLSVGFDSDREVADAVTWAVDHGADVINLSLTRNTLDWPRSWDEAFLYAEEHDVVVVTSAGNRASGTTGVGAPATMPGVLVVGGLTRSGTASWGASSQGITIGVAAPSEGLVAAMPGGGYRTFNGTSGASPVVAGVVALVRAAHPDLDAANVINRILRTARDAGPSGVDVSYGWGILDAAAAVRADVAAVDKNPLGTMAEWITLHRRADGENDPIPVPEPTDDTLAPPEGDSDAKDETPELVPGGAVVFETQVLPWLVTGLLAVLLVGGTLGIALHFRSARA